MGLDDLFKHKRHGHHYDHDDHGYYGGHRDDHHGHHGGIERYLYLFEKLKSNRKLWIALCVAAVFVVIIVIAVIIMLIPLVVNCFDTIQKSGMKGLIETAKPLLDLLWSGSGK
jgi:hypothetical protein